MLETLDVLADREIKSLISHSYELIYSKLTRKAQAELSAKGNPIARKEGSKQRARSARHKV